MKMIQTLNSSIVPANITWRVKNGIADYKVKGICTVETNKANEEIINFYNRKLEKVMIVARKDIEFITVNFD